MFQCDWHFFSPPMAKKIVQSMLELDSNVIYFSAKVVHNWCVFLSPPIDYWYEFFSDEYKGQSWFILTISVHFQFSDVQKTHKILVEFFNEYSFYKDRPKLWGLLHGLYFYSLQNVLSQQEIVFASVDENWLHLEKYRVYIHLSGKRNILNPKWQCKKKSSLIVGYGRT